MQVKDVIGLDSEVGLLNSQVRLRKHNSVTKVISLTFMILVTPRAGANVIKRYVIKHYGPSLVGHYMHKLHVK